MTNSTAPATLTAQISALRAPRNIRTRGLTIAEHDPTIEKTARIAGILREICEEIGNYKGSSFAHSCSQQFVIILFFFLHFIQINPANICSPN